MEENTKKNVYMCILGHFAVQQKLTEHCKSTIPQLKTIKKKKKVPPEDYCPRELQTQCCQVFQFFYLSTESRILCEISQLLELAINSIF